MPENGNGARGGTMVALAADAGPPTEALGLPTSAPASPSSSLPLPLPATRHHQQQRRLAPSPVFRDGACAFGLWRGGREEEEE